ncbi:MAG: DUF177 domain-containing protein [Deltaproteobacteria bacterium]|nr:DUF177 domain-containing protein [Deltaproteobacteria bacterium]
MRVNIDEIKEGGLDRAWDLSREQLDQMLEGDPAGYRARASARVEAHLDRLSSRVLLRARSRGELTVACGRCLAPTALDLPVEFSLTLVPEEEQDEVAGAEAEDHPRRKVAGSFAEADEETYKGREIELDPLVREQFLLALPAYPLCREGCQGLCPVCGQNRNERECGCDTHVPDPRWAGLEKFRKQDR